MPVNGLEDEKLIDIQEGSRIRVDLYAFFLLFFFFSHVLTYCVMPQAFICYCSFVRCF